LATPLRVSLYGQNIGYIAQDPNGGNLVFEYETGFTEDPGFEPSPLMMPIRKAPYHFPELIHSSYQGLPGMIADSLPDHYGTQVIKEYFDSIGKNHESTGPLDMLAYIGKRAFGALEFTPQVEQITQEKDVGIGIFKLWDESRRVLLQEDKEQLPRGMELVYQFGSTAGGARAKAAILFNEKTREFRVEGQKMGSGSGYFPWLMKFDGLSKELSGQALPYERMEYVYSLMAKAAGLDVPESSYFEEPNGMFHFMVKRFDRTVNKDHKDRFGKIHMQTYSAIRHFDHNLQQVHDYDTFFRTCQAITMDHTQIQEAFRRLVFNVLSHNYDDHTKNLAFLMDQEGKWRVSPSYDNVFTSKKGWFFQGHQMTVSGKALDIGRDDLIKIIEPYGVGKPVEIIEQVRAAIGLWPKLASEFEIKARFPDYAENVEKKLKEVDTP
jgi:serine/threonine-protein kinase HipA